MSRGRDRRAAGSNTDGGQPAHSSAGKGNRAHARYAGVVQKKAVQQKKEATPGSSWVETVVGIRVDVGLKNDSFFKNILKERYKDGEELLNSFEMLPTKQFNEAFIKYRMAHDGVTREEAAADAGNCMGFTNRDTGIIYLPSDNRFDMHVAVHEAMHMLGAPSFQATFGSWAEEGTAEFFARDFSRRMGIRITPLYPPRYADAAKVAAVSKEGLAKAYFDGNFGALKTALDGARGAGTYDKWVAYISSDSWDAVNPLD